MRLVAEWGVAWMVNGRPSQTQRLRRGLGMGGPASPLLWAARYDPIVWAVSVTAPCPCPTYVDDLAALIESSAIFRRCLVVLLAASALAGLLVETHSCRRLSVLPSRGGRPPAPSLRLHGWPACGSDRV